VKRLWLPLLLALGLALIAWLPGAIANTGHARHAATRTRAAGPVISSAIAQADARFTGSARAHAAASGLPPIHHVFTIVLENESASVTFGPDSRAPYLSQTLRSEGAYLPNYHGIGHESLDNYIAMISGQAPNLETQTDCQLFENVSPTSIGADGQVRGTGCVYPATVPTIASQLTAAGLTWRDYDDSMGSDPTREASVCGHPAVGTKDNTQTETPTDQYATRHDPFVYFHSIIDNTALCDSHVVNLDLLPHDLATAADTPNYVFITPGLCDDGHNTNCANGNPGGLAQVNTFLEQLVPMITNSPAFTEQNGLLMIVFDEAATSDASSCCSEQPGPESPLPGIAGPGGGDTGAVLISPCIAPGTVTQAPYNHYTMLRSVEDIFGLSHIGYAQLPGETSFGNDIFTGRCSQAPAERLTVRAGPRRGHARELTVSWSSVGISATSFEVEVRHLGRHPSPWRVLERETTKRSLHYAATLGFTYQFRVRGTNATGTGAFAERSVSLR
jgi:hypothetical protein